VNSLDECLEGCKHITLVNKKEHDADTPTMPENLPNLSRCQNIKN